MTKIFAYSLKWQYYDDDNFKNVLASVFTPCPLSRWLRRHSVHAVNDYADTVSALSTTTPTSSPRSQRLRYFGTCPRGQRLRWCQGSQRLRGHTIFADLFPNTKIFACSYGAQVRVIFIYLKTNVEISWHYPFKIGQKQVWIFFPSPLNLNS